jgi:hypothetical protein
MMADTPAAPPGSYRAADVNDPSVRQAAAAAVREAGKGRATALRRIVSAEQQVVAGINYRLCLEVEIGGATGQARAVVYRDLSQQYSLSSWTPGACS